MFHCFNVFLDVLFGIDFLFGSILIACSLPFSSCFEFNNIQCVLQQSLYDWLNIFPHYMWLNVLPQHVVIPFDCHLAPGLSLKHLSCQQEPLPRLAFMVNNTMCSCECLGAFELLFWIVGRCSWAAGRRKTCWKGPFGQNLVLFGCKVSFPLSLLAIVNFVWCHADSLVSANLW